MFEGKNYRMLGTVFPYADRFISQFTLWANELSLIKIAWSLLKANAISASWPLRQFMERDKGSTETRQAGTVSHSRDDDIPGPLEL